MKTTNEVAYCKDCKITDVTKFKKYSNHNKYKSRCNECQAIHYSYLRALKNNAEENTKYTINMYVKSKRSISFISKVFRQSEDYILFVLKSHNVIYDDTNEKLCPRCGNIKSLEDFSTGQRYFTGWCRLCVNEYCIERQKDPLIKENKQIYDKEYRKNNEEYCKQYGKNYYKKHKVKLLKRFKLYHKQNYYTIIKPGKDRYRKENPEKIVKWAIEYEQGRKRATVNWANLDKIKKIYKERDRLTLETGIPHNVDHIIPLNGNNVCGLHVENNLQILTEHENKVKSNIFEPIIEKFK